MCRRRPAPWYHRLTRFRAHPARRPSLAASGCVSRPRRPGPGHDLFLGIGSASAVDRYLSGVSYDVATNVSVAPFHLTLARQGGTATPPPPGSQSFWVAKASGNHPTLTWTVTSGSDRVVVMNSDAAAPVAFAGGLVLTIPHSFAIGIGLLIGGIVLMLIAIVLIVLGARARSRRSPGPFLTRQPGVAEPGPHRTLPGVGAGHRRRESRNPPVCAGGAMPGADYRIGSGCDGAGAPTGLPRPEPGAGSAGPGARIAAPLDKLRINSAVKRSTAWVPEKSRRSSPGKGSGSRPPPGRLRRA